MAKTHSVSSNDPPKETGSAGESDKIISSGSTGTAEPLGATSLQSSGAGGVVMSTTQVTELLFHRITDEELDQLMQAKAFWEIEILLVCLGAAVGALIPFGSAAHSFLMGPRADFRFDDLLTMMIFTLAVGGSIVSFVFYKRKADRQGDLPSKIRSRPRETVTYIKTD